jgi:DNA (cytosine-5)-methyltransferase 1
VRHPCQKQPSTKTAIFGPLNTISGFPNKGTPFLLVYYGSDGSGGWQTLDRPLRTITTVDRFALVEPSAAGHQMRMLQVPELSRAMGFTKSYELPIGTRREKIHMLGNGVCPPVMKRVINALAGN